MSKSKSNNVKTIIMNYSYTKFTWMSQQKTTFDWLKCRMNILYQTFSWNIDNHLKAAVEGQKNINDSSHQGKKRNEKNAREQIEWSWCFKVMLSVVGPWIISIPFNQECSRGFVKRISHWCMKRVNCMLNEKYRVYVWCQSVCKTGEIER